MPDSLWLKMAFAFALSFHLAADTRPSHAEERSAPPRLDLDAPADHVRQIVSLLRDNQPRRYAELLNTNLRRHTDIDALGRKFAAINHRLGAPVETDWKTFKVVNVTGHPRVTGRLAFENGEVEAEFVYGRFHRLLGFRLRSEGFVADAFDALKDLEPQQEHAEQYWRHLLGGEPEKAYELFVPAEGRRVFPKEEYLRLVGPFSAAMNNSQIAAIHLHAVRVKQPTEAGERLAIQVYHLIELEGRRYTARMTYEMNGDRLQATKFDTGNFDDAYPVGDDAMQRRFFRSLVSGDAQNVIDLIHPVDRRAVSPAVLQAFLTACREELGDFRSIREGTFSAEATYRGMDRFTNSSCSVEFANAVIPISCRHNFGWLMSFNVQQEFAGWTRRLEDTTAFERHGKQYLMQLIGGDPSAVLGMLPKELGRDIGRDGVEKIQTACRQRLGAVKSIEFTSKEHLADDDLWRLHFTIETEKEETTGYVTYEFNAFDGRIIGFRVAFPADE
ncbi:MAG: hypothetical protein RIC55_27140 [Pirellulaceae bacterium]